jgi:hypothetical protein
MNSCARSQRRDRILLSAVLFAAFGWALFVGSSPQSHARIHPDANRTDHICAITLIASGSYKHSAQPQLIGAPQLHLQFSALAALVPTWVRPVFFNAHIFALAPPGLTP